jgi:hypothetical protein
MLTMPSTEPTTTPATPATEPSDERAPLDKDGLRLLGLSRVPRCAGCARLDALLVAHRSGRSLPVPWPAAPACCREQICAPLVRRLAAGRATRNDLRELEG